MRAIVSELWWLLVGLLPGALVAIWRPVLERALGYDAAHVLVLTGGSLSFVVAGLYVVLWRWLVRRDLMARR